MHGREKDVNFAPANQARPFRQRGVAQLVAFLVWDQAVAGSSPVTSTEKDKPLILKELAVLFLYVSGERKIRNLV